MTEVDHSSSKKKAKAGCKAPCFLVHPVPSIADDTFLDAIFMNSVSRCVFAGFGHRRFAIAELNSAAMAAKVEATLATATTADAAVAEEGGSEKKAVDTMADLLVAEKEITLADLFAAPAVDEAASKRGKARKGKQQLTELALSSSDGSMAHLNKLTWRDKGIIRVIVSPITIDELHTCGGAVPERSVAPPQKEGGGKRPRDENHNNKSSERKPRRDGEGSTAAAAPKKAASAFPKDCCQKCGSPSHFSRNCDGSGPGHAAESAQDASAVSAPSQEQQAPKKVFPKDCCQKCGSPNHFSRNCDGSGSASTEPAKEASATSAPVKQEQPKKVFPKDCCQKCGSPNHFSRNCDGSGVPASATAPSAVPSEQPAKKKEAEPAAASSYSAPAPKPPQQQQQQQQQQQPQPVSKAPAPSFVRSNKDQCKHCGSEAHLSRNCPNK